VSPTSLFHRAASLRRPTRSGRHQVDSHGRLALRQSALDMTSGLYDSKLVACKPYTGQRGSVRASEEPHNDYTAQREQAEQSRQCQRARR
jgi:hypothetical protein